MMSLNRSNQIVWPRRPNGMRRRASAPQVLTKGRVARPAGWIVRVVVLLAIVIPSLIITSPGYIAFADKLPDPTQVTSTVPEDTLIYAADNKTLLADLHPPGYQNYYEPLSDMGTLLPEAVISIEDRNFYQEPGIDPQGIVRASVVDWQSRSTAQGASTITQQLVKLRLVGNEATLDRKMREALLAFEIERRYTKPQILEWYLNSVFFANTAWGTAAASKIYFHKQTKELDLAQASMLAGVIRGPTIYNPLVNWKSAKDRQKTVLDAMIRDGKVTAADAAAAFAEDLSPPSHMFLPENHMVAPSFVRYVTGLLINKFGTDATYTGGMRVITTLNAPLQDLGQRVVTDNINALRGRNVTQGAMVALDPTTGAILTMVGSANPGAYGGQYNLAVWPPRNPGSSMKIFTYTAAIASGKFTMTTPIADSRISYRDPMSGEVYAPQNYDGRLHGTCQLQACMGNSLNIPAVKVELGIGVSTVVAMARAMGAPPYQLHGTDANGFPNYTTDDPVNTFGPSLTLGGYGETPLQMATGASVLATQGLLRQPYAIDVITRGDQLLYMHELDPGKRVLDARVAFIMQAIMSNDNNRAMIFGRNSLLTLRGRHVGVKTGTSDSFADAWTVGYTPHLVTAVWGGNANWNVKMTKGSDSYYIAAPMWHTFMQQALDTMGMGDEWYPEPPGLIHQSCKGQMAYYMPGTHC
ncbi:MAG: penicillin-binding protein [Chloroflexi bacterium]|nr:MAG: penicillin-binding protein [Chloroflexota bacterium]TMG64646.1 MAG: penicillin-binding protein [Chloroflexota bacterium]